MEGEEDDEDEWVPCEEERPPTLSDKLRMLFDATFPEVTDVVTQSLLAAGELLHFGGNFNKFVNPATSSSKKASSFAICCGLFCC